MVFSAYLHGGEQIENDGNHEDLRIGDFCWSHRERGND
jgi:hypothetical protein